MKSWVRYSNGQILEGPIASEDQPEGFIEYVEILDLPPDHGIPTVTIQEIDGKCVKQVVAVQDYRRQRAVAYPGLGDQMDSLWHAMDDGQIPRVEPFYSDILAVKMRYPKPE